MLFVKNRYDREECVGAADMTQYTVQNAFPAGYGVAIESVIVAKYEAHLFSANAAAPSSPGLFKWQKNPAPFANCTKKNSANMRCFRFLCGRKVLRYLSGLSVQLRFTSSVQLR